MASWKGENPWTFASEILAFKHQDKTRSRLNCDSSSVLSFISAIMKLCLSAKPLLTCDSAAVTFTVIFMASHVSKNTALANSHPLSIKNLSSTPKILDPTSAYCIDNYIRPFGWDEKVDADNLVAWSIR